MDIVVDFDGTVVTHDFPVLGKDIGAVPVLRKLVEKGHKLILFTMRSDGQKEQMINGYKMHKGDFLTQALSWFKENDIPLYGIQTNPTQKTWTTSPKAYGQLIIDDAALGCPLIYDKTFHSRPYVDWNRVEEMLIVNGII
jgi:hypothetical protein